MLGLRLLSRTSNRRRINLASFHSPHSLTWSWILSLTYGPVGPVKPHARLKLRDTSVPGFNIGCGQLIGVTAYSANNGIHWSIALLWMNLSWQRQAPMYYRDMHDRASLARDRLERENSRLRRELDALQSAVAHPEPHQVLAHLH